MSEPSAGSMEHRNFGNTKAKSKFFLKTGRCKFGEQCKFSHEVNSQCISKCRFFLKTGRCKYGENCKFSHEGTSADITGPSLHTFIYKDRPLETQNAMACFVDAIRRFDDKDELLSLLAERKKFGINRIQDIAGAKLGDGCFHNDITYNKEEVSFQRNVIPLLDELTASHMTSSPESHAYNPILLSVIGAESFAPNVMKCLELLASRSFADLREEPGQSNAFSHQRSLAPRLGFEVLIPLVRLLRECFDRFHNKHGDKEFLEMIKMVILCSHRFLSNEASSSSTARSRRDLEYTLKALERRLAILEKGIQLTESVIRIKTSLGPQIQENGYLSGQSHALTALDFQRHDNDHLDYTKIAILPTLQEIRCQKEPYLPKNDENLLGDMGASLHLLDMQFRLIRENLTSALRLGLNTLLYSMDTEELEKTRLQGRFVSKDMRGNDTNFDLYPSVQVERICDEPSLKLYHGIVFEVSFEWPKRMRKFDPEHSNRLSPSSLVALISEQENDKVILFATIASRNVSKKKFPRVGLVMCGPAYKKDTKLLLDLLIGRSSQKFFMLQATSVAYFNYGHVLSALQGLKTDLPFAQILTAPKTFNLTIRPPDYVADLEGCLDMSSLHPTLKKVNVLSSEKDLDGVTAELVSASSLDEAQAQFLINAFCKEVFVGQGPPGTGKSFIGTKIAEIVLANHPQANPTNAKDTVLFSQQELNFEKGKPILCVTYTNHALDQFLTGLIDAGITNVIRVGSTRRVTELSQKEEYLKTRTLQEVLKLCGGRQRHYYEHRGALEKAFEQLQDSVEKLWRARSATLEWGDLTDHLQIHYVDIYTAFVKYDVGNETDPEGFKLVHHRKRRRHFFDEWKAGENMNERIHMIQMEMLRGNVAKQQQESQDTDESSVIRPLEELLKVQDIWETYPEERKTLLECWSKEIYDVEESEILSSWRSFSKSHDVIKQLKDSHTLNVLRTAAVIGMTTTQAAKNQRLLKSLGPAVILVEECGEVLEGHILSSLSQSAEQLIMIGDHRQLRPKIESYFLSCEARSGHSLDISLFERLVNSGYPISVLKTQRRMRPCISDLIRSTIYPGLRDHPSTSFEAVKGVKQNIFFVNHQHTEDGTATDVSSAHATKLEQKKSHSNMFEAQFCVKLANYFVQLGYKNGQVSILTPYVRQLLLIRDAAKKSMTVRYTERDLDILRDSELDSANESGPMIRAEYCSTKDMIRISSIDSFQGEESEIVIISLVRTGGNMGFVKSPNRANVLLSRARKGLYIVGNADTFESSEGMWRNVLEMMRSNGQVGDALELRCIRHPDVVTKVSSADDFALVGDGGCNKMCSFRMECGHLCPRKCHPDDPEHIGAFCTKPCMRIRLESECPDGHLCKKLCGDPCGECRESVYDVPLACKHVVKVAGCAEKQKGIRCQELVETKLNFCGHEAKLPCSVLQKKTTERARTLVCPAECCENLECGHSCRSPCSSCWSVDSDSDNLVRRHGVCNRRCGKIHTCGHECEEKCHAGKKCTPCTRKCNTSCGHSRCESNCTEVCKACVEPCTWSCSHQGRCNLPCGAPCSRLPCDKRCDKLLDCSHRCPSICGEVCPSSEWCQQCGSSDAKDSLVDLIMRRTFKEIDIDDDPIIILGCGHAFTLETLDGHLQLQSYYTKADDRWIAVKPFAEKVEETMVTCCFCRVPLRGLKRYGRVLKNVELNRNTRKHYIAVQLRLVALEVIWKKPLFHNFLSRSELPLSDEPKLHMYLQDLYSAYKDLQLSIRENDPRYLLWSAAHASTQRSGLEEHGCSVNKSPLEQLFCIQPDQLARTQILHRMGRVYQYLSHLFVMNCLRQEGSEAEKDAFNRKIGRCSKLIQLPILLSLEDHPKTSTKSKSPFELSLEYFERARETAEKTNAFNWLRKSEYDRISTLLQWIDSSLRLRARAEREMCSLMKEQELRLYSIVERAVNEAVQSIARGEKGWDDEAIANLQILKKRRLEVLKTRVLDLPFYTDIGEEERREVILGALSGDALVGVNPDGHMYQCPNGHLYLIGECGMAMQESVCPECGERVGGQSHRLLDSNARARI